MRVPRARITGVENILALALTWLNLKDCFKSPIFMRDKQAIQFLSLQRSAFCISDSLLGGGIVILREQD